MSPRKPANENWRSFVERQILEAQQEGAFDHLHGFGRPLAEMDPNDENWWIKQKLKRERLSVLPPSIAIRKDVEKTLARIHDLAAEQGTALTG